MAIAVIGGLITSTALSLLVVPVVFVYVSRLENRVRRLLGMPPQSFGAHDGADATEATEARFHAPLESPSSAG